MLDFPEKTVYIFPMPEAAVFCLFSGENMSCVKIEKQILSFKDIPALSEGSEKTVLLLRHSIRESLQNGTLDPGLTQEGFDLAQTYGTFLKGMGKTAFGASPRRRTRETARALMQGGGFDPVEIGTYPQIRDTSLFEEEETLGRVIENGTLGALLRQYFTTGGAEGMIPLKAYSDRLLDFLIRSDFNSPRMILTSHDIIIVSLLLGQSVYPFDLAADWCGYVQGAALFCRSGSWSLYYTVPDASARQKCALFV